MLTVRFDRLGIRPGTRVLDVGCGGGRHAFEAWRRGATVVAFDRAEHELGGVRALAGAMAEAGETDGLGGEVAGDALALPFPDGAFDVVVAAEVLEHVDADVAAIRELVRVLTPGGRLAVTVPSRGPERLCWALDREYHDRPGGHVRIYRSRELRAKLGASGLALRGTHREHALHAPYWWLRCAVGVDNDRSRLARRYHDLLAWQITRRPRWLDAIERAINPVLGKSLVVYAEKAR